MEFLTAISYIEVAKWVSVITFALLFYTYLGYPLLLFLRRSISKRKVDKDEDFRPTVSVILPLYNEDDVVKEKIENLLSLDYPKDKFQIIAGSDGSSDDTNEIVETFDDERLQFFPFEERRGKSAVLHDLIPRATSEIIVFTDADEMFKEDAIIKLVRNFNDPRVGGVSGQELYPTREGAIEKGTSFYWRYEYFLYTLESDIWSLHSCPGPIYAIRRELFQPYPGYIINDDDIIPLQVALQGYRVVYESEAHAYAESLDTAREEAVRRIRFQAGQYQIFLYKWKAFLPLVSPIALSYLSHRLFRSLSPFFLIALAISSLPLWNIFPFNILLYGQILFYTAGLAGFFWENKKGKTPFLFYIPFFFLVHNYSSLLGLWRLISGQQTSRWKQVKV